jgi:TP901 family phage tail tape measure protein
MSNTADIGIRVILQDGASAGFNVLYGSMYGLGGLLGRIMGQWNNLSSGMKTAAMTAGASGLIFAGLTKFIGYAVDQASELQQAMVRIEIAMDGASDHTQALQDKIISLASNSIFSITDVADGFVTLGQHAFSAADVLNTQLGPAMINLAEATSTGPTQAASILSTVLHSYSLTANDATMVSDALAYSFDHGVASLNQMQEAYNQFAPAAHALNISFIDSTAVLDLLNQRFNNAQQSGTSLRYMLQAFANPTQTAEKEFAALGIITVNQTAPALQTLEAQLNATGSSGQKLTDAFNASGGTVYALQAMFTAAQKIGAIPTDQTFLSWASSVGILNDSLYNSKGQFIGLQQALELLHEKMQNLNPEQFSLAIDNMFSRNGAKGVASLLTDFDQTNQQLNALTQGLEQNGTAARKAGEVTDTYAGQLNRLRTDWQSFAAQVGGPIMTILKNLFSALAGVLEAVTKLGPGVLTGIAGFLLLAGAAAGVTFVVSSLIFIFGVMGPILAQFGGILAIVAGSVFALGAVGGIVALAWKQIAGVFSQNRDTIKHLAEAIGSLAGGAGIFLALLGPARQLSGVLGSFITPASVSAFFKSLGPSIVGGIRSAFSLIPQVIGDATMGAMQLALRGFLGLGNVMSNLGPLLASGAKSAFAFLDDVIGGSAVKLMGAMTKGFLNLGPLVARILTSIPAILAQTGALLANAAAWLAVNWPVLLLIAALIILAAAFYVLFQHLGGIQGILKLLAPVIGMLRQEFSAIGKEIQSTLTQALKQLQPTWNQLVAAFNQARPALLVIGMVVGGILAVAFGLFLGLLMGVIRAVGALLVAVIQVAAGLIRAFMGVIQFFIGFFNVIVGLLTGNSKLVQNGFSQMGKGILNIVGGLWNAVKAVFVGAFNVVSGLVTGFINGIIKFFTHLADTLVHHSIIPDMLNAILAVFRTVFAIVQGVIQAFVNVAVAIFHLLSIGFQYDVGLISGVLHGLMSTVGGVGAFIGGIFNGIRDTIANAISAALGWINGLISAIRNITNVGSTVAGIAHTMHIPGFATGGMVTQPTIALIGEGREPELVLPVSKMIAAAQLAAGANQGGGTVIVNNVLDSQVISQSVIKQAGNQLTMHGMNRKFR